MGPHQHIPLAVKDTADLWEGRRTGVIALGKYRGYCPKKWVRLWFWVLVWVCLCPVTAGMTPEIAEGCSMEPSPRQSLCPIGAGKCKPETTADGILDLSTLLGRACATVIILAVPPGLKAGEFFLARYGKGTAKAIVLVEDVRGRFSYGVQLWGNH